MPEKHYFQGLQSSSRADFWHSTKPRVRGVGSTAVKIGEAVLIPVYGEEKIASEKPFTATLSNDVWLVSGTLHCSDGKGGTTTHCVGGVAEVRISKVDARILSLGHGK